MRTAYAQQQLHYDASQILRGVATLQLLTLVLACLVTNIMSCYFMEVALRLTIGMTTL